jgi:hypothetical protein
MMLSLLLSISGAVPDDNQGMLKAELTDNTFYYWNLVERINAVMYNKNVLEGDDNQK